MWNPILVALVVVLLTASALPTNSSRKQQNRELGVRSNEYDEEDHEEDFDGEPESSDLGIDTRSFETGGSDIARPIQEVTLSNYSSMENTKSQPQFYDRRGHRGTSNTYTFPNYILNDSRSASKPDDYYQPQYDRFYSPESTSESSHHLLESTDTDRYNNPSYYNQTSPESAFNRTAYYEYGQNYSRSQYQGSFPEEVSKSNESRYNSLGNFYGYSYGASSEEDLDDSSEPQYHHSSDSEQPEYRNQDNPRFHQSPGYYKLTPKEGENTRENLDAAYNYESHSQGEERQESSSDRESENSSHHWDRGIDGSRTNISFHGTYALENAYNKQPEQRVDERSRYNQSQDRSEIDESDQEVTFDNSGGPDTDYYDRERVLPTQMVDSITSDPRNLVNNPLTNPEITYRVGAVPYDREIPHEYGNRLVYQPESTRNYYESQARTSYDNKRDMITNSYDRRMSQVDAYWREEERQKKVYDSQNTYRRDSSHEPPENRADCIFDSVGRPINCSPGSLNSWTSSRDAISMHSPPQSVSAVFLPPTNDSFSKTMAERAAFDRANRVQLSAPQWPVRDRDRLGANPRHPACRLPPKWGVGPEERSAWFYSPTDGRCLWFSYAGHGGNANRFYSRANCESLCVFDHSDLCLNARCGYPGSRCMLRGDERCKEIAKSRGTDQETECPPDQPVCRARRAIIPPEYDVSMVPRECKEGVDAGGCMVKSPLIRYYYDSRSNTCLAFYFHGCGGNNNRFDSMQECMNHCAL